MNELSNLPEDPKDILSEAALKRINRAFDEGDKARSIVLKTYSYDDPEYQIVVAAANFNYAFLVLSVKAAEFRHAGVHGDALGEIMREEIEGAVNSLGLGEAVEKYLRELLLTDWGW